MTLRSHRTRAFTLLELIVVVVIAGVLAALAVPTYQAVMGRAADGRARSMLEALHREVVALAAFRGDATITSADIDAATADLPASFAAASETLAAETFVWQDLDALGSGSLGRGQLGWTIPDPQTLGLGVVVDGHGCYSRGGHQDVRTWCGAMPAVAADLVAVITTGPPQPAPTSTTPAYGSRVSFYADTATPSNVDFADPTGPVELGVKFTSDVAGVVTAVRFYRGSQNTGVHTGSLWDVYDNRLATGTFANETTSGWQTLTFTTPVQVEAGKTYTASYRTSSGFYSYDNKAFGTQGLSRGPLHVVAGDGGKFHYGDGGQIPSSPAEHSFFVDVVFQPQLG